MAPLARVNEKLQLVNFARENKHDGREDDSKLDDVQSKPEQSVEAKEEKENVLLQADDDDRLQLSQELVMHRLQCGNNE